MSNSPNHSSCRQTIAEGGKILGTWINSGSSLAAEIASGSGFNFVTIDLEHSPVGVERVASIAQAIAAGGSAECFVRAAGVDYSTIKRYLDAGVTGVIAPLVNTPEEAKELVDAVKYPPQGQRGVGFCRANRFGRDLSAAVETANDRILAAIQIEHIHGVNNLEAILDVQGIDAVFIGPYDLTASMGITAQFDDPRYLEVCEEILSVCAKRGIATGIHVVQPHPEECLKRLSEGYRMIAYSLDITVLQQNFDRAVSSIAPHLQ